MGQPIRTFQDLIAWQRAYQLGLAVCRIAPRLPEFERFGLTAQLRRSGTSVASQIANGYGRGATVEYVRLLKNARATLYELDTQLLFARDLSYITADVYTPLKEQLDESERVLAGLIQSIERGQG